LLDERGVILSVNETWRLFGDPKMTPSPGYAVGENYLSKCADAHGAGAFDAHQVAEGIRSVLAGVARHFSIEYLFHTTAEERWFVLTVTPVAAENPSGVVVMQLDISREKQAQKDLRELALQTTHLAEHDLLTGLPNRLLLSDRIGQAIAFAQRNRTQLAVLFLDLDGFKHINDSLGHTIGDRMLQSVAKRLLDCVRGSDTVSRQGGDEFVVLLGEIKAAEDATILARKLIAEVARPHTIGQHDLYITTSVGVSVYPDDGLDAETLIKHSDTAMYQAKDGGRQTCRFFKPAMNDLAAERQYIEEGLRRAVERGELALHYQPKMNLSSGAIIGAEALLRWTHPIRGPISPAKFIPIAEECGLIVPIGAWVLEEACREARKWADAGLPRATVAVNISARQFRDEHFLSKIWAILKRTGVELDLVELELTESVLMKNAESTASILQTLRESGIRVSIDDFGTGYSSLSYLRKFPVDALKIDQSFVRLISTAPGDSAILTAVIAMAHGLGLRVIAEGVETAGELAFLRAQACDEAQGYLFSRPVAPQNFISLLRSGIPDRSHA
jgi:diguanylate cyclase (GGDEF)-like protein